MDPSTTVTADLARAGRLPRPRRLCGAAEGAARDEARGRGQERCVRPRACRAAAARPFPAGREMGFVNDGRPAALPVLPTPTKANPAPSRTAGSSSTTPHQLLEVMLIWRAYALAASATPSSTSAASSTCPTAAGGAVARKPTPRAGRRASSAASSPATSCLPRRRRLRLRRGLGLLNVARGQEGLPAQQAAAPDGARPVPAPDGGQQRRVAVQRRLDHAPRRPRPSRGASARRRAPGTRLFGVSGHVNRPGVYEVEPTGYPLDELPRRGLRRRPCTAASDQVP